MKHTTAASLVALIRIALALWLCAGCSAPDRGPSSAGGPPLLSEIQSRLSNPATRAAAAREMGRHKMRDAAPLLQNFVADRDPEVRRACIWALGEMGGPEGVDAGRPLVHDADPRIRLETAKAFAKIKADSATKVLLEFLRDDDAEIRTEAVAALRARLDPRVIGALRGTLGDADPRVRVAAIKALGGAGEADAFSDIAGALEDGDQLVVQAATEALAAGGAAAAGGLSVRVPAFTRGDRQPIYIQPQIGVRPREEIVLRAVRILAGLKFPDAAPGLMHAIVFTEGAGADRDASRDREIHSAAADALVALGADAMPTLAGMAISANCRLSLKAAAAAVCARIGAPAVEPIVRRLSGRSIFPDPNEPRLWIRTLGEIGDPRAAPALLKFQDKPLYKADVAAAVKKIEAKTGAPLNLTAPAAAPKPVAPPPSAPDWADLAVPVPIVDSATAEGRRVFFHDVTLLLEDAIFRGAPRDLEVYLGYADGKWDKHVQGYAMFYYGWGQVSKTTPKSFNAMDHEGIITEVRQSGDHFLVKLEMDIHDDPWVPGGRAKYLLELHREGPALNGVFSGDFNGAPVKGKVSGAMQEKLWPSPVAGHVPVQPGEHPRLLFRKADLPALRRRAESEIGKEIMARLAYTLGMPDKSVEPTGAQMPSAFNPATKAYGDGKAVPVGSGFTNWHAMGFGFLYQLTGEKRYAELARQCAEEMLAGVRDCDARYAYVRPGGKLRAGWSYSAMALAYDFCYEAWDEAFRRQVAASLQEKIFTTRKELSKETVEDQELALKEPVDFDLVFRTSGGQHCPSSNHYGAWNGGGGLTTLAIMGDPGTDDEIMGRAHRIFLRRAKRALLLGFNDIGYFYEGHHCGRLPSNTGLAPYLQALRVCEGRDYAANSRTVQSLPIRELYELVRQGDKIMTLQRGMYASPMFGRGGNSTGGDFAFNFGICLDEYKPAVLWFFNHVIEPQPRKTYDAIRYPVHAVYALVNWPIGVQEKNPAEVLPSGFISNWGGYHAFRNRWQDENDITITLGQGGMYRGLGNAGDCSPSFASEEWTTWSANFPDRSAVLVSQVVKGGQRGPKRSVAVDFSGLSGAPALTAEVSFRPPDAPAAGEQEPGAEFLDKLKQKAREQWATAELTDDRPETPPEGAWWYRKTVPVAGLALTVRTYQIGQAPLVKRVGQGREQKVIVGKRTLALGDEKIVLGFSVDD